MSREVQALRSAVSHGAFDMHCVKRTLLERSRRSGVLWALRD